MALPIVSSYIVYPEKKSVMRNLKLSTTDLLCLSVPYIKCGNLFEHPRFTILELTLKLKIALSRALAYFPPLAGRLITDDDGFVHISCNDKGAELIHVDGSSNLTIKDLTESINGDFTKAMNHCFPVENPLGYEGHSKPVLIVQVTELADGIAITVTMSHVVADGVSYVNFFNSFAELSRGLTEISRVPDFDRDSVLMSSVVPRKPSMAPLFTYSDKETVKKIFKFSSQSIQKLKTQINETEGNNTEISSLQCLFGLLWSAITRARKLPPSKKTTFLFAINCRHRIEPPLHPFYFGNAVQGIRISATAKEIVENGLFWCAKQFNESVTAYDHFAVKRHVERNLQVDVRENLDDAILVGFSPRFPMYESDFGWGKPIAILSGTEHRRDGTVLAFPGRDGGTDFHLVLALDTMMNLEADSGFMRYVSLES